MSLNFYLCEIMPSLNLTTSNEHEIIKVTSVIFEKITKAVTIYPGQANKNNIFVKCSCFIFFCFFF